MVALDAGRGAAAGGGGRGQVHGVVLLLRSRMLLGDAQVMGYKGRRLRLLLLWRQGPGVGAGHSAIALTRALLVVVVALG